MDLQKLKARILKAAEESFAVVVAEVDRELDAVIQSTTEFADIGLAGRDIVDSERLLNSKVVDAKPTIASFTYDPVSPESGEHYAARVYNGFFIYDNPKNYLPGRRWTERAVNRVEPTKLFTAELRRRLK